jgi:hypothetical protein
LDVGRGHQPVAVRASERPSRWRRRPRAGRPARAPGRRGRPLRLGRWLGPSGRCWRDGGQSRMKRLALALVVL